MQHGAYQTLSLQFIKQDSLPGTFSGLQAVRLRNRHSNLGTMKRFLSYPEHLDWFWGPPSASHKMGFLPPEGQGVVQQQEDESDHSHPSSADFKNAGGWNSTPPYAFTEYRWTTLFAHEISYILWSCKMYLNSSLIA